MSHNSILGPARKLVVLGTAVPRLHHLSSGAASSSRIVKLVMTTHRTCRPAPHGLSRMVLVKFNGCTMWAGLGWNRYDNAKMCLTKPAGQAARVVGAGLLFPQARVI